MRTAIILGGMSLVALALAACGDDTSAGDPTGGGGAPTGAGPGTGVSSTGTGTGTSSGGAGGSGTSTGTAGGGGEGPDPLPTCYQTCNSPADCVSASVLFDEDNYACNDNRCEYLGCQDTSECTAAFMSPNYACETTAGSSLATCVETCTSVADCVVPSPLYDDDNYACNNSRCEYLGCQDTSECTAALMNPDYVCETAAGTWLAACYLTCAAAGDCAITSVLYDEDNYACTNDRCEYLGCQNTGECTSVLMDPDYVCE
jgi:hypothetical protein